MEQLINLINISKDLPIYLAIDLAIAGGLLLVVRALSGIFIKISVSKELGEKDNFAFGISLAGRMLSLTIVLSAVVGRHIGMGFEAAALGMLLFGSMGILLVKIGRFTHDIFVLNKINKDEMIENKNVSVAIVDACSAIASALITKSIIDWAKGTGIEAFIAVFCGSIVVLVVLLLATRLYEYRFSENNQNSSFQQTLAKGQLAISIQHGGNLIGIAIAVSSASKVLIYSPSAYVSNVSGWLISAVVLSFALIITTAIIKRVVLIGVNWRSEISLQHNIGIASIEAALSIGIALLFFNIFV